MTLIQSTRLNGQDLYAYLKGVLTRLPTQKASALNGLLPQMVAYRQGVMPARLRTTESPDQPTKVKHSSLGARPTLVALA